MKLILKLMGGLLVLTVSIWALILTAQANIFSLILSITLIILLLVGYFFEFKKTKDYKLSYKLLIEVIALIVSGITTFYLSSLLKSPVAAAALMGLVGAMIFLDYKDAIYIGAFAGMSSIFNIYIFLIVLLIVSFSYILIKPKFEGIGGKGGLTAFIGVFIVFLFLEVEKSVYFFKPLEYLLLIGISIISSMLTYFLTKYLDNNNVLASGFVGLIFGVMLMFLKEELFFYLSMVGFGSTFIGMQNRYKFYLMPVASIIFVFLYSYSYMFMGLGGLLGFLAFLSNIPIILCQELVNIKREKDLNYLKKTTINKK
ncbi:MAG: hypothetical protein GX931_01915 [Acholeplasmataceae bacterium]|nr:hypothetical protein [Acholeplasmataceae bacterium]